jgi:hypothetical protein
MGGGTSALRKEDALKKKKDPTSLILLGEK